MQQFLYDNEILNFGNIVIAVHQITEFKTLLVRQLTVSLRNDPRVSIDFKLYSVGVRNTQNIKVHLRWYLDFCHEGIHIKPKQSNWKDFCC